MSLILEALKKSEMERQRGQAPTVFTPVLHESFPRRSAFKQKLAWILTALCVLIIVGAVAWWVNASRNTNTPATIPIDTADSPMAVYNPSQTTPIAIEQHAPVSNEKPASDTSPQPVVDAKTPMPPLPTPAAPETVARPVPPIIQTTTQEVMQDDALPIAVLSGELRQQLPPMKYTMHVYSDSARDRFAIVDGNRVSEGSLLGPAVVTEIRRDGLVIEWSGTRYLVAKP